MQQPPTGPQQPQQPQQPPIGPQPGWDWSSQQYPTIPAQQPPQQPPSWQPQQHPQPRKSFWQSFGGIKPRSKIAIGIGAGLSVFLIVCVMCSCLALALGSGGASTASRQNTGFASAPTSTSDTSSLALATATTEPTVAAIPTDTPAALPTATHVAAPIATPRPKPVTPTATPCPGVNCSPWGYNFSCCNTIANPPAAFCSYFPCIANFPNGNGYVEECVDGMYSKSGGIQGSCSRHGGNLRALLAP